MRYGLARETYGNLSTMTLRDGPSVSEEEALIRSFVVAAKQERYVDFLAHPKRRRKATAALAHFADLDSRWVVRLPSGQHTVPAITEFLRSLGAGETCHVISESEALDGQRLPLGQALDAVIGHGMGTLLSCVPGRLAFFEGEGPKDRCILVRRPA
jgi:hypothetical protein